MGVGKGAGEKSMAAQVTIGKLREVKAFSQARTGPPESLLMRRETTGATPCLGS
jgi:hypothetical protein